MEEICSICLLSLKDKALNFTTICGHEFHAECFCNYRKITFKNFNCPNCRLELNKCDTIINYCNICSEPIGLDLKKEDLCGHEFHIGCYRRNKIYNGDPPSCPSCRSKEKNVDVFSLINSMREERQRRIPDLRIVRYEGQNMYYKDMKRIISGNEKKDKHHRDLKEKFLPKSKR